MYKFPLRGTTIINLTVAYSLIVGLLGAYNWFTIFSPAQPIGLFGLVSLFLISIPYLAHALVLYQKWRGAWPFTIILYGLVFTVAMLAGLSTRFTNHTFSSLIYIIFDAAIVFIFWTNNEVKIALGKYKTAAVPAVDVNMPNT